MNHLSIIIVAYQNTDCLARCLQSIPIRSWIEVIVINNTQNNRGFSQACNLGYSHARGNILLFLNPDCIVNLKGLEYLFTQAFNQEFIGIVGPTLINDRGKPYLSCSLQPTHLTAPIVYSFLNKYLKSSQLVRRHWFNFTPPLKPTQVGIVSGAAIAIKSNLFKALNGFDPHFFLYWEEVDLTRRVLDMNKQVVFDPNFSIIHSGAKSTPNSKSWQLQHFRRSRWYFFHKHFGLVYAVTLELWLQLTEGASWIAKKVR